MSDLNSPYFNPDLFSQQGALAGLIHEFNILPVRYVHRSWLLDAMGDSVAEAACKSARTEKIISAWIISELKNEFHYDFEDIPNRLALLDNLSLQKLIIYTGTAINAKQITKIIEGKKILNLKKKFVSFKMFAQGFSYGLQLHFNTGIHKAHFGF